MSWIFYTIIALCLWTVVNILDKYIVSKELRDPMLATTFAGFFVAILFIVFSLLNGSIWIDNKIILASILAGIAYSLALWFYFRVLKEREVSSFVPLLSVAPLLIALFAFLFLGEKFSLINYLGIILIVGGAILISLNGSIKNKIKSHRLKFFAGFAVFGFVFRDLLLKYSANNADFKAFIFWFAIGVIIIPSIFLIIHHPHLRQKAKKGVSHLVLVMFFSGLALISFTKALSLGPVTLVAALFATKPLLVFIIATLLSFYNPKIIRERHSTAVLLQKSLAIILIILGTVLIMN